MWLPQPGEDPRFHTHIIPHMNAGMRAHTCKVEVSGHSERRGRSSKLYILVTIVEYTQIIIDLLRKIANLVLVSRGDRIKLHMAFNSELVLLEGPRERPEPVYEGKAIGLRPSPRSF